jgi:hypothetical protein
MASVAAPAPQTKQLDPPIDGRSGDAPLKTNQLSRVGLGAVERWTQRGSLTQARRAPYAPTYGYRRLAPKGHLERIGASYRSPQKGMARRVIRWPRARAQMLSIT